MMDYLKEKNTERVLKNIENDPTLLQNLDLDQNNIDFLFNIRYGLKISKLFLMIINVAYFTGVIWIIGCQLNFAMKPEDSEHEYFYDEYELHTMSNADVALILLYYSFTTLSTIGFGDFHPKDNIERIFCAIIMVGGVMVFSYIMGNFVDMIKSYEIMNSDIDDGDNLSKFLGLMKKFNKGKDINEDLKKRIEEYFSFRWNEDKL